MAESRNPVVVCLGVPAFGAGVHAERLAALDPRVEPVVLPVDDGGEWATVNPAEPCDEPPPWARAVASERLEVLARAEVLIALHAPRNLTSLAPKLRWIHSVGAGVEQFARAGVARDRVVLTNASGISAPSMAEWVLGRLLQIWKRFREADFHQERHAFERTYGRTFAGSTVGIVGLGSIGREVSQRLRALGVRVLGQRRSYRPGDPVEHADAMFGLDELHDMLGQCDAVIVAAPETPETRHLIDARALSAMRSDAVLVNVARGSLVDEAALAHALRSGGLAAAVLDVFDQEPLPPESPIWELPNVYISAHSSVSVDRYMEDVFDLFEENVRRYLVSEPLHNQVDMEALGFS